MKIKELEEGDIAIITDIKESEETCRLCTLGFQIGHKIKLIKNGNVLVVKVLGSKYCITQKCLDFIDVEKENL